MSRRVEQCQDGRIRIATTSPRNTSWPARRLMAMTVRGTGRRTSLGGEGYPLSQRCSNGGFALGSGRFKAQIAAKLERRVEPGAPGRLRTDDSELSESQIWAGGFHLPEMVIR